MESYKLSEKEKQDLFEFIKKQVKKAKYYKEAPALEYLFECRERVRFGIFAEKKEREICLKFVKGK